MTTGRRALLDRLIARVLRGAEAVRYPDHPLLLRGPECLAALDGELAAFFLRAGGVSNDDRARCVLSRFALPSGTRHVLVTDDASDLAEDDSHVYDELLVLGSRARTATRQTSAAEIFESVRGVHHERFARTWTTSVRGYSEPVGDGVARLSTAALNEGLAPRRLSRYIDVHDGTIFAAGDVPRTRSEATRRLGVAVNTAVRLDYGLIGGPVRIELTAGVLRDGDAELAVHRNAIDPPLGVRTFDVLKPIRAAAFAGFVSPRPPWMSDVE